MFEKKALSLVIAFIFTSVEVKTQEASCKLPGIPTNSPYELSPISDEIPSNQIFWKHPVEGLVYGINFDPKSDWEYQSTSRTPTEYRLSSNDKTALFTRDKKTRLMTRSFVIYCRDKDNTTSRYDLTIPVLDFSPPIFEEKEYNFEIDANWDRKRAISEGQFIIVSDNAYEIGEGTLELEFIGTPEGIVRIATHKLWVEPDQLRYYYRLDLFLDDSLRNLTPGEHIQLMLSARDQSNSGLTTINIYVSK